MSISNKSVLYIGSEYFRLHKEISNEIRKQGAKIDFFPIKKKNIFQSILRIVNKKKYIISQSNYQKDFLNKNKHKKYNFILIVHVPLMEISVLDEYKKQFNTSKFIMYSWDSIEQNDYLSYIEKFDKVLTFDMDDAKRNLKVGYLPLFYTNNFGELSSQNYPDNKCVVFVGTCNNYVRYQYIKEFALFAKRNDIKFYNYLSISWKKYLKFIFQEGKILNLKYLKFIAPSIDKIIELYKKCEYVIDVPNNKQSGLTMRIIETLGAGKYLLTTNRNIVHENIYDSESIFLINHKNFNDALEFIQKKKNKYTNKYIKKYSLESFIKMVFE